MLRTGGPVIEFAQPWAPLLLLLPVLVYAMPAFRQAQDSLQVPFFQRLVRLTGETPRSGASIVRSGWLQRATLAISWVLLTAAAANPQWVGPPINLEKSARDLMIALDLSGSMDTADFRAAAVTADGDGDGDGDGDETTAPEQLRRLDAAKQVLRDFASRRAGDRLGLVVFGNAAYLQAPFTDDLPTWEVLLEETEVAMAGQSTALGDAIGLAIALFMESQTDNRVLVVLTDGNDTGSRVPPRDAAEIAAAQGVTIYTVAVGDPEAVGEDALDMDTLNAIAERTNGASFQALDGHALRAAYATIDALEPAQFDSLSYRPRTSLFHYPLGAFALLNLTMLAILAVSRRRTSVEVPA